MEQSAELVHYIRSKLGVDERAEIEYDSNWKDFRFDMIVNDKKKDGPLLIKIRPRASLDDLALLNLYRDYLTNSSELAGEPRFVLVTRSMPDRLWDVAEKLNIDVLTVPKDAKLPQESDKGAQTTVKITSEKSWKVVSGLIRLRSSSIRNLSITQGVSYGWAHSTVSNLITHGIAKRTGNLVSITDIDKLLNGAAWERPTQSLIVKEIDLPGKDVFEAAKELTETLDDQKIPHGFTNYMAGTLYTGYSVRYDSLQVYLDRGDIDTARELMASSKDDVGLKLQVMVPDRKLFDETRVIDQVRIVSPAQTLLDLASLGYKGKDITKALVAVIDQI